MELEENLVEPGHNDSSRSPLGLRRDVGVLGSFHGSSSDPLCGGEGSVKMALVCFGVRWVRSSQRGPSPQACVLGRRSWWPSFMLVFPPHHPEETLRSLASPSSLQGPELHGWRPPVDCVRANELCAAESNCSSRYRTLRQCLAGRDRNTMLANKECQAALEVLQESPLYDCRCKRGMKKELQCLQIYWSIHLGLTDGKRPAPPGDRAWGAWVQGKPW